MWLRLFFVGCQISSSLLSLSQEPGTAKQGLPWRSSYPAAVSKGGVFVVGDVHTPTGIVLEKAGHITVLQALAFAEGPNPTANLHNAKIIRRKGQSGATEIPVDLKMIMQANASDVTLQAGDILFVPRSAGKSSQKKDNLYYDVPPSAPLQDVTPTYIR